MSKNKYEIDMCNGTIMDKLISFSVPLMLSGILQLMFNAVDIIVVGRFAGSQSLAAVGSTTALINMFVNLFIGVSLGANVLAARFYASGKHKEMSETVHTAITFAAISGVVMALIGVLMAKPALELMGTPDDVINLSTLYMRIYFLGMPFFMLYNYGAAVLRAVGDTKRPLMFLIAAGIINACLNMVLVIVFNLGVAGVAIATIFSQFISCVLVLRCLNKTDASYQLRFSKLKIKGYYLKQIFQVGIPAGIQSTVINFSNALLQSSVNSFGSTAMAGYTAANNILGFLYASINSVTQACMSFTSQNYGVRKFKRMDKVLIDCVILSVGASLVFGCGVFRAPDGDLGNVADINFLQDFQCVLAGDLHQIMRPAVEAYALADGLGIGARNFVFLKQHIPAPPYSIRRSSLRITLMYMSSSSRSSITHDHSGLTSVFAAPFHCAS